MDIDVCFGVLEENEERKSKGSEELCKTLCAKNILNISSPTTYVLLQMFFSGNCLCEFKSYQLQVGSPLNSGKEQKHPVSVRTSYIMKQLCEQFLDF